MKNIHEDDPSSLVLAMGHKRKDRRDLMPCQKETSCSLSILTVFTAYSLKAVKVKTMGVFGNARKRWPLQDSGPQTTQTHPLKSEPVST